MRYPPAVPRQPGPLARAAAARVMLAIVAVAVIASTCAAALAPPVLGQQASGDDGGTGPQGQSPVSVAISSVNPRIAGPGKTVTVTGTVTNTAGSALAGLSVQLFSSATPFTERDELASYASGALAAGYPVGSEVPVGSLRPGATARWQVSLPVGVVGMSRFGVYPLAVETYDSAGTPLGSDRTFLPFWPGASASGITRPLKIAWIWPLISAPQQGICPALDSGSLAASVGQGGRLRTLLDAGASFAGRAKLTWAIDPALLQSVATMTRPYRVGGTADCAGGTQEPASAAAARWLSGLRQVTSSIPRAQLFVTPYADVDVAALTHRGLDKDLTTAYAEGRLVASGILGRSFAVPGGGHTPPHPSASGAIAWPADGLADSSVLGNLAVNGIGTVVLSSSEMRPVSAAGFTPDAAVTTTPSGVGTTMDVLLADDTLTQILGSAGSGGSASSEPGSGFGVSQRFLAETAMIAAEAPGLPRAVVVAPPREWDPTAAQADGLLSDTVTAPWLMPATLAGLAGSATGNGVTRQPPPASLVSPRELSPSYLSQVSALDAAMRLYKGILDNPGSAYLRQLSEGVAAAESSAWRGSAAARRQGESMLDRVAGYLSAAERKVRIVSSARVTLGGSSGKVPVSIANGLRQAVQVRLEAVSGDGRLAVGRAPGLITVGAGQTVTTRLPVRTSAVGDSIIRLRLLTRNGTPLPAAPVLLNVQSTQVGDTLLLIIGGALGVLVLTGGARAVRRGLREERPAGEGGKRPADPAGGERSGDKVPGPAGKVPEGEGGAPADMTGVGNGNNDTGAGRTAADPRDPSEVPDDFADARDTRATEVPEAWVRHT
ncbi:MAG TPA: DUF6049 family protein [Streptosporangiaceae bacterium]|nr:DUF6049 family protein [Streptosporangiaceae bacterium]